MTVSNTADGLVTVIYQKIGGTTLALDELNEGGLAHLLFQNDNVLRLKAADQVYLVAGLMQGPGYRQGNGASQSSAQNSHPANILHLSRQTQRTYEILQADSDRRRNSEEVRNSKKEDADARNWTNFSICAAGGSRGPMAKTRSNLIPLLINSSSLPVTKPW